MKIKTRFRHLGEKGTSAVEMALILPILLMILFSIIDLGRFIHARYIISSVSREGGSLGSRDIQSAADLITMLQNAALPLDLATSGRIFIWKISAGTKRTTPYPFIDTNSSRDGGALSVSSSIGSNMQNLGISQSVYNHLVFNNVNNTADISQVTVVEVFYRYTPITPVRFVPGLGNRGYILSSKAEF
jgi:hypothetical protein